MKKRSPSSFYPCLLVFLIINFYIFSVFMMYKETVFNYSHVLSILLFFTICFILFGVLLISESHRFFVFSYKIKKLNKNIKEGIFKNNLLSPNKMIPEQSLHLINEIVEILNEKEKKLKISEALLKKSRTLILQETEKNEKLKSLYKNEADTLHAAFNAIARSHGNRTREIIQINRFSELLHNITSIDEIIKISLPICSSLFPTDSGSLTLYKSNSVLNFQAWGQKINESKHCKRVNCNRKKAEIVYECENFKNGEYELFCLPIFLDDQNVLVLRFYLKTLTDLYNRKKHAKKALVENISGHFKAGVKSIVLKNLLKKESITDPLTGLYNRRYMEDAFLRELTRSQRESHPITILITDIDHFKKFNDTYGHDTGDIVLKNFADVLKINTRNEDVVCRFGGEEFVILMPGLSLTDASAKAEHLRYCVENASVRIENHNPLKVTASFGLATYPFNGNSLDELIVSADKALYNAKAAGRNQVCVPQDKKQINSIFAA